MASMVSVSTDQRYPKDMIEKINEEERNKKIQHLWMTYRDKMTCDNIRFSISGGSVLKFAVSSLFEDFIYDAALFWKVDLNQIDGNHQDTLLDYVKTEIERNKGTGIERTLRSYYDMLKAAGAKHKSEL